MAIEFARDDESRPGSASPDTGSDDGSLREALPVALRSTLLWLAVGAVVLLLGMLASKRSILAANSLLRQTSGAYLYAWVPTILFGFYGLIFGGLMEWRTSSASGLTGPIAWVIGAAATTLLASAGALAAVFVFPQAIPTLFWVGLGLMVGGSLLGVSVFALWVD